ncbi:hypothetical protein GCM10008982_33430 [Anoxybacillus voinovskiensis]|nr:hypothetical protein GCM10008982_33430 [Anoxybacillus voinovskiensis]
MEHVSSQQQRISKTRSTSIAELKYTARISRGKKSRGHPVIL